MYDWLVVHHHDTTSEDVATCRRLAVNWVDGDAIPTRAAPVACSITRVATAPVASVAPIASIAAIGVASIASITIVASDDAPIACSRSGITAASTGIPAIVATTVTTSTANNSVAAATSSTHTFTILSIASSVVVVAAAITPSTTNYSVAS